MKLDDFIQEFDNFCDIEQMHNFQLFMSFVAWKTLFQHLEGPLMDDYHEFTYVHETMI
jgi:hypothetical protein